MQTTKISDTLRNQLHNPSCLPNAIPSQYPWLEDSSHKPANKPAKWFTENSILKLSDVLLSEEDMRPLACAAWAIVLARYTGREDACFGIIYPEPNDQSPVGVLAVDCESTLTVIDLIARVKSQFEGISRNAASHCLDVRVLRNYLAFPLHYASEIVNVDHLFLSPPDGSALILWVTRKDDCIFLRSDFDPNISARREVRRVMRHFLHAFQHVISSDLKTAAIGELKLLTLEDNAELREWNSHATEPVNNLLHTLFQEAAKSNPEKVALLYCAKAITYKELDIASSNLAHQILQADDSITGNIPICIKRSPEMIIAMIAVLKANKTFVPVDPKSSKARRDRILRALQSKVILVSEDLFQLQLFDVRVKQMIVSHSTVKIKTLCQINDLSSGFDLAQPAYILFTSGSTGIPKGVVIEHRNVCTSMKEIGRHFDLNSGTRMFQYASLTFDASILEIFATLIHGGCVCIPTETERLNNIPKAIKEVKANTALMVPSVLKLLNPEDVPTLKKLIVGGENLTQSLINIWAEKLHVINAYGPTETCVCSLANLRVSPGRFGGNIGTSIACRTWVVDPNNERQLMPIGAIGELWIEGPTVARGYLDDLAGTKARFASSLPWVEGGDAKRAYRTGDLVRYLPNGELLFLGRKDNQVKLNGQRIELEEIEACICRSSIVADASVQVWDIDDSTTLAAFLIPQGATIQGDDVCHLLSQSETELHTIIDNLREQLPSFMVPRYLLPINFIPRMTSGKVDQHTLAAILEQVRLDQRQFGDGDKSEEEQELPGSYKVMKDLWASVLNVPPASISTGDGFLHLGGDSIKAMKLVSAARDKGILLTVGDFLKNYTVDELIQSSKAKPATLSATRPRPELQSPSPQRYTPTWVQMVSLTTSGGFPEENYIHIIMELRGRVDLIRLREACRSLVEKNEILRTQYSLRAGTLEATILDEVEVPLINLNSRLEALEHWESTPSICFDRQLVSFSYVVMDENLTQFALGMHHSQYDAWTVPLLLRQLQSIYHGHVVCPGPPFSEYATRLPLETNLNAESFWKKQLADLPMTVLSDRTAEGDEPDGHFQKSLKLLPSQFTFATIMYSAWALVLSKHAHTGRVVFAGAVSGRNIDMEDILGLVGPCINTVLFTIDITKCATFLEVLQTARDALIATVPYEAMPTPDVITRCTKWNPTAAFGSTVQHLDISFDIPPLSQGQYGKDLDILKWKYLETKRRCGRCRATDIYVFSTTSKDGTADVQLKFNPSRVGPELAEVLFGDLCEYVLDALQSPEQNISKYR